MPRATDPMWSEQFAIAFEVDPIEIYHHILALSLKRQGNQEKMNKIFQSTPKKQTWSAMYGIPVQAILNQVILPQDFPNYRTRILNYNMPVPPMGTDNYAWIGIVSGEAEQVKKFTPMIKIETSAGSFNAII